MPVEIRELVFRTTVSKQDDTNGNSTTTEGAALEPNALIAACAREVFKLIERSGER